MTFSCHSRLIITQEKACNMDPEWLQVLEQVLGTYVDPILIVSGLLFNLLSTVALSCKKVLVKKGLRRLFILLNVSDW